MYMVCKIFCVEEAHYHRWLERLSADSPLFTFPGFEKREIVSKTMKDGTAVIRLSIIFTNKKAYYQWEASPEHIAMHRQKHEKPKGLIDVTMETYDVNQVVYGSTQTHTKA